MDGWPCITVKLAFQHCSYPQRNSCISWSHWLYTASAWMVLFQVPARLRGTSAAGMTPVVVRWSGRGSNDTIPPSDHTTTTGDRSNWLCVLWHSAGLEATKLVPRHLIRHMSGIDSTFPVISRLLHEGEFQPRIHTEWGSTPESATPRFIPLLPDSVSDARTQIGFLDLHVFSCRVKMNDDTY